MNRQLMIDMLRQGHVSIPVLFFDYYKKLGLNEKEVMVLFLVFRFAEDGEPFPTPDMLSERMTVSSEECMTLLRALIQRRFLAIKEEKSEAGVMSESYSLEPFYEQVVSLLCEEADHVNEEKTMQTERELYDMFERELARPLSPMETETISMWIDQDGYSFLLIRQALQEAVLAGKLNLRYIDRILFEWQKNGIKTPDEARKHSEKYRAAQQSRSYNPPKEPLPHYPNYNWLDN
ncbi:DnaD domain-containing protein [Salsuginibacillus kocurii]|uniref:DnaD domain-containing protein n=1 Tax=Salsuginibacillus kocurii TaxID=427078 RepID=UPI00036E0BF3|nr:DnaD domain-containing protein [Salsuginibacillus kocurii]